MVPGRRRSSTHHRLRAVPTGRVAAWLVRNITAWSAHRGRERPGPDFPVVGAFERSLGPRQSCWWSLVGPPVGGRPADLADHYLGDHQQIVEDRESSNSSDDWKSGPGPLAPAGRTPRCEVPHQPAVTCPSVTGAKPVMASMNVVFPAPFGPDQTEKLALIHTNTDLVVSPHSAVTTQYVLQQRLAYRLIRSLPGGIGASCSPQSTQR